MIYQVPLDFNTLYRESTKEQIIINDLPLKTDQDREMVAELIRATYETDTISLKPSCICGTTTGYYNLQKGVICGTCNNPVKSVMMDDIDTNLWFRRAGRWDSEGSAFFPVTEKLLHPKALMMLLERFQRRKFNIIQYLMDRNYSTTSDSSLPVMKLREQYPQRGYNYFVQNFESIMTRLFNDRNFRLAGRRSDPLRDYIFREYNAGRLFSDQLPIPNRCLRIVEPTVTCTFVERTVLDSVSAINLLVSIDRDYHDQSSTVKESRVARALIQIAQYYAKYNHDIIDSTKKGTMRRQIYSMRSPWTFRAVITSKAGVQGDRKMAAPWGAMIALLQLEITNVLTNRMGYTDNDARGLIYDYIGRYHPLLDHIVNNILIPESPRQAIEVLANRNPSLGRASILRYEIGRMKTNPRDQTMEIPIPDCPLFNADFDGDAMNFTKATDNTMAHMFQAFDTHRNAFGMFKPFGVNGFFDLAKPTAAAIASWLRDAEERNKHNELQRSQAAA